MDVGEIKQKLAQKGYWIVDGNFYIKKTNHPVPLGLILEHKDDEEAIADIRYCEKKVVLPNTTGNSQVKRLEKILVKEAIQYRPHLY